MNLLLFDEQDQDQQGQLILRGRRAQHVRKVLRAAVGDQLRVGQIDGALGMGTIVALDSSTCRLEVQLDRGVSLPEASPVVLALAACRPPTLAKVLTQATAMGVKRFEIFHCRRVEKSYWDAKAMSPEGLRRELLLGLEQCIDTRVPTVVQHRRFRPFAEDVLGVQTPALVRVAHPHEGTRGAAPAAGAQTLVLGPEGGFVPFELDLFRERDFEFIDLGPRILRVETAAVVLLGQQAMAAQGACR